MSKIYDALIQAGKKNDSRTAVLRTSIDQKTGLLSLTSKNVGAEWKILGTVAAVMLVFGFLLVFIASQTMSRALRSEINRRALAVATNLSNAATGPVIGKNILDLYAVITKYAQMQGVAYAFIEDANGKIVGHSMRPFPPELTGTAAPDERKQVGTRVVTLQGKTVYESRVPMLEGQLGAVHLGMWADGVKQEIDAARLPFVVLVFLALLVAVALSVFVVHVLIAPIDRQTDAVNQQETGDLSAPVENRIAR